MAIPLGRTQMSELHRHLSRGVALGRPSRQGPGDELVLHVLRADARRGDATALASPLNGHLRGAGRRRQGLALRRQHQGLSRLRQDDRARLQRDRREQVAKGSAWIGTPADIVEMIRSYNDKVGGFDSVSLHFTPANMPVDAAERSMRLFAREVMPKVAAL